MTDSKIQQDVENTVTIVLNSLADGSGVNATAEDLGGGTALLPQEITLEFVLDGLAGSTAHCEIYLAWSPDNANFTTDENADLVGTIAMNGTTIVNGHITAAVKARYVRPRVVNESGAALAASGNTLSIWPLFTDNT